MNKRQLQKEQYKQESQYSQQVEGCTDKFMEAFTPFAPKERILDSGQRSEFITGAVRDCQEGKGRLDLLPVRAILRLAQHFEEGCKKYGDRNWEKGIPLSRFMDSGLRHAFKHLRGDTDEPHLIAAIWNLMCLYDTQERIKEGLLPQELNDLPEKVAPHIEQQEPFYGDFS